MPSIERKITIETATVIKVIAILLVLWFMYLIRDVLALLFIALFLAALMNPAVDYLSRWKIPKGLTVIVMYLLLLGLGVLFLTLLVPPLIEQSSTLLVTLNKGWEKLSSGVTLLKDLSVQYGLSNSLAQGLSSLQDQLAQAAEGLFSTVTNIFGGLVGLILVLVVAFYMVVQETEARNVFRTFVPGEYQDMIAAILKRVQEKISRWLIGQLALGIIIGILYFVALSVIGVNAALVLALFAGFTEFIPYLGPILGSIPALFMALTISPVTFLLTLAAIVVIQQLENHVIVPKVMQKAVGLNPLVSVIAVLVGAKLFGFVGILLAIPVATAVSAVLSELYHYRKTHAG